MFFLSCSIWMSCLGLLLLSLANQKKGDHSHENTLPFSHHKVQRTQLLNSKDQYSAGSFAVRPFPRTHPFVQILQSLSTEGETLLERFYFPRSHSKKDDFLWLCHQLPRENLQPVSQLSQNRKRHPGLAPACQSVCACVE